MGKSKVKPVEEKVTAPAKPEAIEEPQKTVQKQGKAKVRSQKYQQALGKVDRNISYPLSEALDLVKNSSYCQFPATVELHLNTRIKGLRGLLTLPYSSGKKLNILVFAPAGAKLESKEVTLGDGATIEEILKGKANFDVIVAHPSWMPKLATCAKVLGPRGIMPNPKNGTITEHLEKAIDDLQAGKMEYKTEANGKVIHMGIGKVSQPTEELSANVKALYSVLGKSKVAKITLSPTMGPGVKVDLNSI